ncbi:ABC transporter ATP-binding protein [Corticibacter populi]|uniref:ABC transporter ATP-binding protein n=1 Tax=Corticibacter populi TaxID=1550736 RepID=A0A3M6QMD5_9BURK|nr:ABC transporter ATP-binding protein [Corticibacter populi]RMX04214.1 ABC transporter ATP-binding protein [Corticibacter populi]RZS33243.1 iron complex transport system ATP-binding protein [Corticibacter populi]
MNGAAAPSGQALRLQARGLRIGHGRRVVADGLSLTIGPGEIVALLGPNGGGKTTLFRTLLGLLPPLGGQLLLDGRAVADWPRRALAQRIAYVPQATTSHFGYAVLDMVLMGRAARLAPLAQPQAADRALALQCLALLGVEQLAGRNHNEISGGERQLVLIARALAQQPALLVMDEPTASLDFGNQQRVLDQIGRLRDGGMAVLLSTHQPEHALAVADRLALLHEGRLIGPGAVEEIATVQRLAALYRVSAQQLIERLPRSWSERMARAPAE